ncbi:hypothetical protein [Streptomyces olivochromogenes]|uniref:hypothetical protein n=1 Tax=Streptomyces olivochromogenes TaxID=1963 RepID=UPI001F48BC14|nr:hypothetical protein [Streptomyces olivochromogenes]
MSEMSAPDSEKYPPPVAMSPVSHEAITDWSGGAKVAVLTYVLIPEEPWAPWAPCAPWAP